MNQMDMKQMDMNKQKGMGLIGMLVSLVVLAFIALVGLRVAPIYVQDYSVKRSFESLDNVAEQRQQILASPTPKNVVMSMLQRYFSVNGIYDVSLDPLTVESVNGGYQVKLTYQRQVHFIANIDLLMTFDHQVDIARRDD